uniref:Exportin-1/Importin-beta-like domain-containing protein n=1 Tax=Ditylenchus dipsaci TaxID=166011 RepID=A0A915D4J8_9BILA
MSDMELFSLYVQEFYNTQSEVRRKELQTALNKVQEKPECWKMSMMLVQGSYPGVVQFYGAKSIYTLLSKRFDEVVESSEKTNEVREFFVQKLSSSAQSMPHSLLNVLSSGFAVFLLKCLPDVWPDPFTELINLWFTKDTQQELLLRVLAEVAAEYQRLTISWKQKRILKSSLLKVCPTIVQISHSVLADPQSSPSMKNAAVECIELWLKLPGAKISDFMEAFTSLFNNIASDIVALSRILSTLKSNEELPNLPQIIKQITKYIAVSICPVILNEVNNVLCGTTSSEDITPLICAVTEFVHGFIRQIVAITAGSNDQEFVKVYFDLCLFFTQLSTLDALYPTRECISDLPEPFWTSLREELLQGDEDKPYAANKRILCNESVKYFLELLQSATGKISFFLEIETQFEAYRISRGDVSSNAMLISPTETINIFVTKLNESLDKENIFRSESVLFYVKEAADFIKGDHLDLLYPVLCKCNNVKNWRSVRPNDFLRFANTLLDVLQRLEHLILTSRRAHEILPQIIKLVLDLLVFPELGEKALETVITYVKNKDASVQTVLDPIISSCYSYFETETNPELVRLQAMKAVGKGLSFKPWEFILNSLDQILLPRLVSLKQVLDGSYSLSISQQKSRVIFELSVIEQLVATIETNQGVEDIESATSTPVQMILNQCVPLFDLLLGNPNSTGDVVEKVCDVLRAGVLSLHTSLAPLIGLYVNYLDMIIFKHPIPASELAKSLFLAFRSNTLHARP